MTDKPTSYVTQHAPWPTSQEDATAETLCKALAARAAAIDISDLLFEAEHAPDEETRKTRWRDFGVQVHLKNRTFALTYALRAMANIPPDGAIHADLAARDIWGIWDEGCADEWLWDWLTEYSLDPEQCLTAGQPATEAAK